MIKKTLDSHKKTLDYKSKLTHSENAQKMGSNDNHRHYARKLIGNQRQKKTGDSSNSYSNVGVCLYKSLKLSTDDQVTLQLFNSKHIILSSVI